MKQKLLHPFHLLRNKGDTENFDLENLLLAFKILF